MTLHLPIGPSGYENTLRDTNPVPTSHCAIGVGAWVLGPGDLYI